MPIYIRANGTEAPESEARIGGRLQDGYSVRVPMLFMDASAHEMAKRPMSIEDAVAQIPREFVSRYHRVVADQATKRATR
jgi:hypothetical protein